MHRKFSHGGPCNIVPGPRGLEGPDLECLFPDLCGPDILTQEVDRRESVIARALTQRLPNKRVSTPNALFFVTTAARASLLVHLLSVYRRLLASKGNLL